MDLETVRQLSLARHLFELGVGSLRSANDMHLFSAANLLQDAVESFLIAVADVTGATLDPNTKFDKYFQIIETAIAPKTLPFKIKLLRLNRIRIDSKHYGIQPERSECNRLAVAVREFFDEVSSTLLGSSFSTISAIDLLREGETRSALIEAKQALSEGRHDDCAIACRKALYLEIEKEYDVSAYKDGEPSNPFLAFSKAPHYARSKRYVEESVACPTDYVVYDYSSVNEKLLTQGVDNTAYWNVWRLTPEVYRSREGKWIVKHEFGKLDDEVLADKIDYIFSATLDVVLSIHRTWQATQWVRHGRYYIELTQENVPIYAKADRETEPRAHTPEGMSRIDTDFKVSGLNDEGPYWHVLHFEEGLQLFGFVHNDSVRL